MSIQQLIKNQQIRVDNHGYGNGKVNSWDSSDDVHLHKKVHGKGGEYEIKVPLNSNRKVTIKCKGKNETAIPEFIEKEIQDTFKDDDVRRAFVDSIVKAVKNYNSQDLNVEQRARQALGYIGKAFNLGKVRKVFKNDIKEFYAHLYYTNSVWTYIVLYNGVFCISNNTGSWKRFKQNGDEVIYFRLKNVNEVEISEFDILDV